MRKRNYTRCGGSGHFGKYCDNTVDPAFGESFDENVGQQPVASTDDENVGQQPVAST